MKYLESVNGPSCYGILHILVRGLNHQCEYLVLKVEKKQKIFEMSEVNRITLNRRIHQRFYFRHEVS